MYSVSVSVNVNTRYFSMHTRAANIQRVLECWKVLRHELGTRACMHITFYKKRVETVKESESRLQDASVCTFLKKQCAHLVFLYMTYDI